MEYLKRITILFIIFGLINTGFCKPSGPDSITDESEDPNYDDVQGDDDYHYDDGDVDKSGGGSRPIEDNDTTNPDPPYFEISNLEQTAYEDDDVILFCDAKNLRAKNLIMWYNGTQILTQSSYIIKPDPRISMLDNHAIKISNVQLTDSNKYNCSVLPESIHVTINLKVVKKPKAIILSDGRDVSERSITFRQGEHVKFECRTSGVENATIKWSLNGERADLHVTRIENGILIIDSIDSHHAGRYQCLGDAPNVAQLPHSLITVHVQFSPKVSTHRHHINTANGDEAELYCDYHADPIAIAEWKRDGQRIPKMSDKYLIRNKMHNSHNRTILLIKNVDQMDIGQYECEAKNGIGRGHAKIRLQYEPEIPQFENIDFFDGNRVTIYWLVRSKQPLVEASMKYKLNESVNPLDRSPVNTEQHHEHTGVWKIRHDLELTPGIWHTQMRAKNSAGWSEFSRWNTFTVQDGYEGDNSIPQDIVQTAGISPKRNGARETLVLLPSIFIISFLTSFYLVPLFRNI